MSTDTSSSLYEAVDVITDYTNFFENMIIPTNQVRIFVNNKSCVSKQLKYTLNEKKRAFMTHDHVKGKKIY